MDETLLFRVRAIVRGRVQGVGFRRFVYKQARAFAIGGWVRNCTDGSVEIEVIGAEPEIQLFLQTVRKGSFISRVDELETLGREKFSGVDLPEFIIRS